MPSQKFIELQDFKLEDLVSELSDREKEFTQLKIDHAIRGLDNPIEVRNKRKDIARLKTEVRRRELETMSAEEVAKRDKIRFRRRKK